MEFVTLTKNDPEFKKYLWGTFDSQKRAMTVETFHADSPRERVTFKIQWAKDLQKPSWWKIYLISARPEMWLLSLGPAVATMLVGRVWESSSALYESAFAMLALFFLHNSACLLNDVMDHIKGSDRANRRRGSQVIQKGWSTARHMFWWAIVNFALAIVLAIPALIVHPMLLLAVGGAAVFSILISLSAKGARYGLSDAAFALLYGPLIVAGMAIVQNLEPQKNLFLLAINFGWLSMWVLQARQIENLFRSVKESHRTFLGYLNFDLAKTSFLLQGAMAIFFVMATAYQLKIHWLGWALFPLAVYPMIYVLNKTHRAVSPLSSDFLRAGRSALLAHATLTVWWWFCLGIQ